MIDQTVFNNKKAAYYTLGCKLNFAEMTAAEREREIAKLEKEMRAAAKQMEYEYAAVLRDRIIELRGQKS